MPRFWQTTQERQKSGCPRRWKLRAVSFTGLLRSLTRDEHLNLDRKNQVTQMRWVLTLKGSGSEKARLVVLGYQAHNLCQVQAAAPTMSRHSRNVLLALAANGKLAQPNWQHLWCGSLRSGHATQDLQRLLRPCSRTPQMVRTCVWQDHFAHMDGARCCQTISVFFKEAKALHLCRCAIEQHPDSITIDQDDYYVNRWLEEAPISKERMAMKNEPPSNEETSQLRGRHRHTVMEGKPNWTTVRCRCWAPSFSAPACHGEHPDFHQAHP